MRKKYLILVFISSILMLGLGVYWGLSTSSINALDGCTATTTQISVSGIAKQEVTPDRAVVVVNVIGEDEDADVAMSIMKDNAQYVINKAKNYTEEKFIKTLDLQLRQKGRWRDGEYVVEGFVASETIKIDVDVQVAGKLISDITKDRSENVRLSGISFYYSDRESVEKQLLEKAILDAKDNAVRLVKPLGAKYISLVSVSYNSPRPLLDVPLRTTLAKGDVEDIPISAGSQSIVVQVLAVFEATPICMSIDE